MGFLFTITAAFVLCGTFVTLVVSRLMRVRLNIGRFFAAFLVAALISFTVASMIVFVLAKNACSLGEQCEYAGFAEGGIASAMIWLICYSITYLVAAFVVARVQSDGFAEPTSP